LIVLTSLIPLVFLSLCLGLGFLLIFFWALRSGQFEDPEGPKYRMLFDDDESENIEDARD
jgi:cbb3-type cytochrome oxidase maturation protein